MKRILITGGAGFIGSNTADRLLNEGYDVVVVDNLTTGCRRNVNSKARFHDLDIGDDALVDLIRAERIDAVIHAAAQINVRDSVTDPVTDARINIVGTIKLLRACAAHGVKRIVFASSGGTVYGNAPTLPAAESTPLSPHSPYGIAKATCEHYLEFFRIHHGLKPVILRYANVFGPRQNPKGEAGVIAVFIQQILDGKTPCIWGPGDQTRDFVYIDDVTTANLVALRYAGKRTVFNIGSGVETSVNAVYAILAKVLDAGKPAHNPDYSEEIQRICLDASCAATELKWLPQVDIATGIERTVAWYHRP